MIRRSFRTLGCADRNLGTHTFPPKKSGDFTHRNLIPFPWVIPCIMFIHRGHNFGSLHIVVMGLWQAEAYGKWLGNLPVTHVYCSWVHSDTLNQVCIFRFCRPRTPLHGHMDTPSARETQLSLVCTDVGCISCDVWWCKDIQPMTSFPNLLMHNPSHTPWHQMNDDKRTAVFQHKTFKEHVIALCSNYI